MRYLPLSDAERGEMMKTVGVSSIDEIFSDVPESARLDGLIDLPRTKSEMEVERGLKKLSSQSLSAGDAAFFCGAGAYRHHVPAAVDHVIQRSEFLTAYTPYQPEISQGTLQTLFEFQTQVALLTGMDVANASMYDGSTACAEGVLMAARVTRRNKCVFAPGLHPHYAEAAQTLAKTTDIDITEIGSAIDADAAIFDQIDDQTACVVVQTPNVFGTLVDLEPIAKAAHEKGALLVAVVTEAVSLGAVKSPGEMGADIVAAEGQSIGNALSFGGPYVGLFACREKFVRQMPGRLAGETVDADGNRGFVLTLSTREQHIRRGRATSNICTNAGLCALAWTIHMTLLGEKGLRDLARLNHRRAVQLADRLDALDGAEIVTPRFFNEFAVKLSKPAAEVVEALAGRGVLGGVPFSRLNPGAGLDDILLVAVTETATDDDFDALENALKGAL